MSNDRRHRLSTKVGRMFRGNAWSVLMGSGDGHCDPVEDDALGDGHDLSWKCVKRQLDNIVTEIFCDLRDLNSHRFLIHHVANPCLIPSKYDTVPDNHRRRESECNTTCS